MNCSKQEDKLFHANKWIVPVNRIESSKSVNPDGQTKNQRRIGGADKHSQPSEGGGELRGQNIRKNRRRSCRVVGRSSSMHRRKLIGMTQKGLELGRVFST